MKEEEPKLPELQPRDPKPPIVHSAVTDRRGLHRK